jgi:hypothetical protein
MQLTDLATHVVDWLKDATSAIAPAALGALVSQAYQRGLAWRDRLMQTIVGIAVSWYGGVAVCAIITVNPFALQSVRFVLGMIAFQAMPRFMAAAADLVAGLPADFKATLQGWLGKRP